MLRRKTFHVVNSLFSTQGCTRVTYRSASKFYDLFGSKRDVAFYRDVACQSGTEALELGVGTGRVALALAHAGIQVLGLDSSSHMLRLAHEKLAKEPEVIQRRVTFRLGDMRNFDLNRSFPFIYLPASTFDHNLTHDDQHHTLRCVHTHLRPGGRFAFDLDQIPETPDRTWWIDRHLLEGDRMVVRSVFKRRDESQRQLHLDLFFDVYADGNFVERYHEYGETAILTKDDVAALLDEAGFRVCNAYGDFNQSSYRSTSPRLVLVATRT